MVLSDLSVRFPGAVTPVLHDIGLEILPGERVCVVGSNGSGKSTLAYTATTIVPRLIRATVSGRALLLGRSRETPMSLSDFTRGCSFLFQNPEYQLLGLTIADELAFALGSASGWGGAAYQRVGQYLDDYGLRHLMHRDSRRLSLGEMQKVAILSSVACRPAIVFFDEPTSALDSDGLALMQDVLARTPDAAAVTLTHDLAWGRQVSSRVVALQDGRIALDGTWSEAGGLNGRADQQAASLTEGVEDTTRLLRFLAQKRSSAQQIDRVVLQNVSFRHPGAKVDSLAGFSLEAAKGEVVCLVGPNGSGKTTAALLASGLVAADSGSVTFLSGGRRVYPRRMPTPRVALMLQNPAHQMLADDVAEELALSLRCSLPASHLADATAMALDAFDLPDAARAPDQLSFGQQRKLSFACCLCLDPDVFVLDEPELGLDATNLAWTSSIIRYLARELGRTVIMVSHDIDFARTTADRIVSLASDDLSR